MQHDRATAVTQSLFDLPGAAAGEPLGLLTRIFSQTTAKLGPARIDNGDHITAFEVARDFDDADRQQAVALAQGLHSAIVEA